MASGDRTAETRPGPLANAAGWAAVLIVTSASGFWAFWGVIEAFHEGWHWPGLGMRIVQTLAYLSGAIVLTGLAAVSLFWPRAGGTLFLLLAAVIATLIVVDGARLGFTITALITAAPAAVGLLFLFGRPRPRWLARWILVGLPLVVAVVFGAEPAYRVNTRYDDGDRGPRVTDAEGVRLMWAPAGPGWAREGNVTWDDAKGLASRLSADGVSLGDEPLDLWRLPTRAEVVQSLTRGNQNAGGEWDTATQTARYTRTPGKESPLWDPDAPLIYLWTSDESDANAWMVVYHGGVYLRNKALGASSLGFRAVRVVE